MSRRALLIVTVTLVLAAASTWLSRETRQEARQAATSNEPDYFINNFAVTQTGPDGQPTRRLTGTQLTHFPDRQMLVQQPHLTLYQGASPPWEVTARTATLDDAATLVQLDGDVRIFRTGPDAASAVTETLRLQPQRHYAETDAPITFTTAAGRLQAVGMEAFLNEQRVVLRSRVRGVYERKAP